MIIAPHTSPDSAHRLAERVTFHIAQHASLDRLTTTASIGVATMEPDRTGATTARALVEEADRALYNAKQSGRTASEPS